MGKETLLPGRRKTLAALSSFPNWIWMWLGVFVFLLVWGVVTTQTLPLVSSNAGPPDQVGYEVFSPGWGSLPVVKTLLSPWLRWDTVWYLLIAKEGYTIGQASLAFPPLFPILIRLFGLALGRQYLLGALLVSWLSFFGACFLLVDWIKTEKMQVSESRVIQFMLFFPTAFFFFAGYTESLFLLLALLGWRFARRGKWGWVGLVGALAILTRFIGVCLFLPYLWIFWEQFRAGKTRWTSGVCLGLMPAAFLGWNVFSTLFMGDIPSDALVQGWALHFDWPWVGMIGSIKAILTQPVSEVFYAYVDILVVIFAVWSIFWWLRRRAFPESLFVASVLLISVIKISDLGVLGSTARYLTPLFPIYLAAAKAWPHPVGRRVVLYGSALLWLTSSAMFFTWNWIA